MENTETDTIETLLPKAKTWSDEKINITEGYSLKLDEDGEYNPNFYAQMVEFRRAHSDEYDIVDNRPVSFDIVKVSNETILAQKENDVRAIRGRYMQEILAKVDRYKNQKDAGLETTDSEETYKQYLLYLQYLRDIPQSESFPNDPVKTFDEWRE